MLYEAEAGHAPEDEFAVTENVVVIDGLTVTEVEVDAVKPSAASQLYPFVDPDAVRFTVSPRQMALSEATIAREGAASSPTLTVPEPLQPAELVTVSVNVVADPIVAVAEFT